MSQEQFTNINSASNKNDSTSNQNLDKKKKDYLTNQTKVGAIRSYSGTIIKSRLELEKYLLKQNIRLVTSFSDFVVNNSFIESSYVIYEEYKNNIEKLSDFVSRNPEFLDVIVKIEEELRGKTEQG